MYSVFEAALRLELRPSRRLRYWLIAVHTAVLLAIPWLPPWLGCTVLLGGTASAVLAWRHCLQSPPQLLWRSDGRWELAAGGEHGTLRLARRPFVHPQLVVIALCPVPGGRVRAVPVFPDMLDAAAFRRLRVRLRHALIDAAVDADP